ncbi:MAG TPA: OmpH family outer membrane protein [Verrucomicrobiae bacterium]|nr:OmpH family outer membrane protein [Verrucomicrobiae bacterium]
MRRTILLLALICILLLAPLLMVHFGFWSGISEKTSRQNQGASSAEASPLTPKPKTPESSTFTANYVTTAPDSTNTSEIHPGTLAVDESRVFISSNNSGIVAVVDLKRIADALPATLTSEAIQKKLAQIQQAVTAVASARNFSYIFDKSAVTPWNTPIVLFDSGAPDLTDAVLQLLKK